MTKVAAVQAAPVWMDAKGTLDKTIAIIEDAGRQDIELLAFGEVWLPGYPFTIWLQPPMVAMEIVMAHRMNAITVDGPEMKAVGEAAKRAGTWVMLGFAERDRGSIYARNAAACDFPPLRPMASHSSRKVPGGPLWRPVSVLNSSSSVAVNSSPSNAASSARHAAKDCPPKTSPNNALSVMAWRISIIGLRPHYRPRQVGQERERRRGGQRHLCNLLPVFPDMKHGSGSDRDQHHDAALLRK